MSSIYSYVTRGTIPPKNPAFPFPTFWCSGDVKTDWEHPQFCGDAIGDMGTSKPFPFHCRLISGTFQEQFPSQKKKLGTFWLWVGGKNFGVVYFSLPQFFRWRKPPFHFLFCSPEAFKDNRESHADMLAASSWDNLFSEGFVEKLGEFIVKLHRKRVEYVK